MRVFELVVPKIPTLNSMDQNPRILCLSSRAEATEELRRIGVEPYGIEAMAPKIAHINILLESVECRVANILKQEMLSIGGDVAVSRGTVDCSIAATDALIIGTRKQLDRFVEKIARQPFGISKLAEQIRDLLSYLDCKTFTVETSRREIPVGLRPLLMGILNVTPDSFSDGGNFCDPEAALDHALQMEAEGADIIDIGAESTRPGSEGISVKAELERVIPVLKKIGPKIRVPLSIDTTKADVAEAAADLGIEIINDISALRSEPRMTDLIARSGLAVVLMHMRGTPKTMQQGDLRYATVRGEIIAFLRERMNYALSRGVPEKRIIVDPGIGFGKNVEDNLRIIKYMREFKVLGKPLLVGPSRKGFLGKIAGEQTAAERVGSTAAVVTACVLNGVDIIRVHDIKQMRSAADVAHAVAGVSSL